MPDRSFCYMTFHRVRFGRPYSNETDRFAGPEAATHWLFGPDSPVGEDGLWTRRSDVWGGVAFYGDLHTASSVMDDPRAALPWLAEGTEAWHALLCPTTHRGRVNWFGGLEAASNFRTVPMDKAGPLAVMTSAGFRELPPDALRADIPRRADFVARAERVRAWYHSVPGCLAQGIYHFGPPPIDGLTFTLWDSDAAMTAAAYGAGVHRRQLDRHAAAPLIDRTSFTRARLLRSAGAWGGQRDPLTGRPTPALP